MMDNDTAAKIADYIVGALAKEATFEGFHIPHRPMESLQDVIYWLLRTETIGGKK